MSNQSDITVQRDNRGIIAGRDIKDTNLINTGDVTGSYNAIGVGAQVIINQIQEARSAIAELSAEIQLAETQLADAVAAKIQKLLQAVERSATQERSNPYRSLLDYRLEDAPYFYGRKTAIRDLLDKIHDHRLTILHADSGSGKSSLLQAGLAARLLAAGHLPLRLRPYREPVSPYIKRAFLTNLDALPELERFRAMPLEGFLDAVSDYLGGSTLYLFLDQFEEFFVEQPHVAQEQFIQDLADCLDETGLDVRWVLSMRKEYFSDLRRFQPRIEPFANEYFLPTFQLTEAKDVIVEPARKQGVDYESNALVDQILADLQDTDGTLQPPQVQLVCYNLFEEVRTSATPNQITTALYQQPRGRGETGAKGILSSHLSRVLKQMEPTERTTARRILEALVTSQTRRERVAHDALLAELQQRNRATDAAHLDKVLAQLITSRLLRTDEDDNDNAQYELAHDYLLGEIELDPETLARKAAQELLNQEVVAWQVDNRSRISEEKLRIIEEQQANLLINAEAAELLHLSQEAIGRRRRTVFVSYGAAAVAAVVAIVAGIVAYIFLGQADTAQQDADAAIATVTVVAMERSAAEVAAIATLDAANQQRQAIEVTVAAASAEVEKLNAEGEMLRLTNFIRSETQVENYTNALLGAQEAIHRTLWTDIPYSASLDIALRELLRKAPPFSNTLSGHSDFVGSAIFNHDSSLALTTSTDGTAKLWDVATGNERHTFAGHKSWVFSAVFNPDSSLVVTASNDGTAKIWDVATGSELHSLIGHHGPVNSAVFNHDGTLVVTASVDGTAKVWSVLSGHVNTLWGRSSINSAAFSPDGTLIVTAGANGTTTIWDVETWEERHTLSGHNESVESAHFSPDGTLVVTASFDGTTTIWDVETGEERHTLSGHSSFLRSALFSPDGSLVVTAGWDGTAKIWDVFASDELHTLNGNGMGINSAVFNHDGSLVVTASWDGTATIWDVETGEERHALRYHDDNVNSAVFSHDGNLVITASNDGTAKIWDLKMDSERYTLTGHTGSINSAAFNRDGSLVITASADGTAKVWNVTTGEERYNFTGHKDFVNSAAFSPDGNLVVTASADGTAMVWDVATGSKRHTFAGRSNWVDPAVFNQDGSLVMIVSNNGTATIWEMSTGHERHTLDHSDNVHETVTSAVFSPDGSLVATASVDGTAKVWDTLTGSELYTFNHNDIVNSVTFNRDGSLVATASDDGTAKVWEIATGKELHALDHSDHLVSAVFSPDGSLVVTASWDSTAKIWEVATGSELYALRGHGSFVNSAFFNQNGTLVVTASADGTAKVWDAALGKERHTLIGHSSAINSAAFSPNGSLVVTASTDGTAMLWHVAVEDLLELVHQRISRNPPEFTEEERIRFGFSNPILRSSSGEE